MKLKYRTQTQKPNQIQKTDQKQPQKQLNFKHQVRIHKRSGERGWKGDVKNVLLDMARSNPKNENPNFTARGRSNLHARRKPNTSQRMIKKEFFVFGFWQGKLNNELSRFMSCRFRFSSVGQKPLRKSAPTQLLRAGIYFGRMVSK